MKYVKNTILTNEEREKMFSIGTPNAPETFTKDDYLTPAKVAKKFGISTENARSIMKRLMFKRANFALNGHRSPIVTNLGKKGAGFYYLHPLAITAFQQYLEKQKD